MERMDDKFKTHRSSNSGRLLFGLILLVLGSMMIARHFHWLDYDVYNIVFSWQMLLIAIGSIGLLNSRHNASNYILIFIGLFFMLTKIPDLHFDARRLFWPFIFIFMGLLILTRHGKYRGKHWQFNRKGTSSDFLDDTVVFGGGRINMTTKEFKGGRITSIFGGSEYNFHQAELADGENVLDVFHVFGGSKLLIPPDWNVKIDVMAIFGGYSDKRINIADANSNKQLYIKGMVIFGGGEIKTA